jgi:RNA processing factor Prp31
VASEEISIMSPEVQESLQNLEKFSAIVKLKSFLPFSSAEQSLEQINAISEGELTQCLMNFLDSAVPKKNATLGITDPKLGNLIVERLAIKCKTGQLVQELLRGIRIHFDRFVKGMKASDLRQAQLGLGHTYSRAKVKFNVHRVDNMIVQSISLLDQLDKDLNTFAMRVREWYGWHFPELVQVVKDNFQYCQCATLIKDRSNLTPEMVPKIAEIVGDDETATRVLESARRSMGTDISLIDITNIDMFAARVVSVMKYRTKLFNYLSSKMNACAPNLSALIGEQVGARLIAHAGSLTSLAKYPASTVQILGAEKALFRALKTKGPTPKYGLIFHSSFISRAKQSNKGRISRYLANKCSLASRIDCFSETSTNIFGKKLNAQVEERLEFYKSGKAPRKNQEVMAEAVAAADTEATEIRKAKKRAKKQKTANGQETAEAPPKKLKKQKRDAEQAPAAEPPKKKKHDREAQVVVAVPQEKEKKVKKQKVAAAPLEAPPSEKKKKKKKAADADAAI